MEKQFRSLPTPAASHYLLMYCDLVDGDGDGDVDELVHTFCMNLIR